MLRKFRKPNLKAVGLLFMISVFATGMALWNVAPVRADDLPVVHVSGELESNETWTPDSVYVVDNPLIVPDDVTLTISAGTIVKFGSFYSYAKIQVDQGGALDVNGTSTSNVIFTSLADDSAGGDSGNDGATTGAPGDYNLAIYGNSGDLDISFATFRNGQGSIWVYCGYGGSSTVSDNMFKTGASFSYCTGARAPSWQRNTFDLNTGSGNYAIVADHTDLADIVLSGSNKNVFSGSGLHKVLQALDSAVASGDTWNIDSSSGVVLELRDNTIEGTLNIGAGVVVKAMSYGTAINNNGLVTVGAGTLFKLEYRAYGIKVNEDAILEVNGSSGSPAIFTSMLDDSVGGDTGGDGSTTGATADYTSAIVLNEDDASVELDHAVIKYAGTAVSASRGSGNLQNLAISDVHYGLGVDIADVIMRGSIQNASARAITACNWNSLWPCSVDAAYVDWGNNNGPFSGSNSSVCGAVTVSPWITSSGTSSTTLYQVLNCDNTSTPKTVLNNSVNGFHANVASRQIDCDNGFQDACNAISSAFACLGGAVQVIGNNTPVPVSFTNPTQVLDTVQGDAIAAADALIAGTESASVASFTLAIAHQLSDVLGLFTSLNEAYNNCSP
jgi:hypothetical protein